MYTTTLENPFRDIRSPSKLLCLCCCVVLLIGRLKYRPPPELMGGCLGSLYISTAPLGYFNLVGR